MRRRISVLTVIDSIGVGGAEALLPIFLRHVDRDRFEIRVLALNASPSNHLHRAIRDASVDLVEWNGRRLLSLARIARLARFLHVSPIDVVHTHLLYSNVQATLAAWRSGTPSIATLHNLYPSRRRASSLSKRAIETSILRATGAWSIAVAAEVERAYTGNVFGLSRSRVTTIPNAIDLSRIECISQSAAAQTRSEVLQGAPGPLIVSVGRIAPQKGYVDLVRAVAELAPRFPGMRVAIAGRDAGSGPEVRGEISRLGLEGSVILVGERDDVPSLLKAADMFAMSSHWEGAPIVLLEAMAAGVPIVATRVGGVPEVLRDGVSGALVPPGDPCALGLAIGELLRDRDLSMRYAEAAHRDVQQYNAASWTRQIERQYVDVLASHRARGAL